VTIIDDILISRSRRKHAVLWKKRKERKDMNAKIINAGVKVAKFAKGAIPLIGAGLGAVMEVVEKKNVANTIKNLEDRVVELEKLLNK
jgi:hypothetical protein